MGRNALARSETNDPNSLLVLHRRTTECQHCGSDLVKYAVVKGARYEKRNGVRKIRSIADLAELLGGRENLDAIVRQRLGIGLDEVEGTSEAEPQGQRPYRWRRGRTPVRTTLVEARIDYYDGRDEDRVRLQVLTDGTWQISGWPHAPLGEKRPREKSFRLSDIEASSFEFQLGRLTGLVPGKGHRANEEYDVVGWLEEWSFQKK